MIDVRFAYVLGAGMLAAVNPCGFALLPAYLSYFLGAERTADRLDASITRALTVGVAVSAGFMVVFGAAGVILAYVTHRIYDWAPRITIVIGAVLVVAGVAMALGWEPRVRLPRLDRGGRTRGLGSMFVFGISYAIASLGCTLPVFFSAVSDSFDRSNLLSAILVYLTYALGMALVLMVLTLAIALARQSIVTRLRQLLPFVNRLAGVILVLAGGYVILYSVVDIRNSGGDRGPVRVVTNWSGSIQRWLSDVGPTRVALIIGLVLAAAALVTLWRWGGDRPSARR